jgi:hypothetical protein
MMKHTAVLIMKFITCIIAFTIGLDLFFAATIVDILSFSLVVTIVSYIVGDRIILPRLGNTTATVVDFILTYMCVWIFGSVLLNNYLQIAWGSFLSAIVVTVAEIFVHRYLLHGTPNEQTDDVHQARFNPKLAYGTEFAEEQDINDRNKRKE